MRTRTKKIYQGDIANKKSKEQLLGRASHCSLTGSGLKQYDLNQNGSNICFSALLLISAKRPMNSNKLVETKRGLTFVGESQPR